MRFKKGDKEMLRKMRQSAVHTYLLLPMHHSRHGSIGSSRRKQLVDNEEASEVGVEVCVAVAPVAPAYPHAPHAPVRHNSCSPLHFS
jgi:hypothetical protein